MDAVCGRRLRITADRCRRKNKEKEKRDEFSDQHDLLTSSRISVATGPRSTSAIAMLRQPWKRHDSEAFPPMTSKDWRYLRYTHAATANKTITMIQSEESDIPVFFAMD